MGEKFTTEQKDMILYALSSLWHEIKDSEEQEDCTIYSREQVERCYRDMEAMFYIFDQEGFIT
jgi:hypothetical protein